MVDKKSEVGGETATRSAEAAAVPPATTVHEAELAPGPSGAVEYGMEIDEAYSGSPAEEWGGHRRSWRRNQRESRPDLQDRGPGWTAEQAPVSAHQQGRSDGSAALPSEVTFASGHAFYETDRRKARKKP